MRDPTPRRGPGWSPTRVTCARRITCLAIAVFTTALARFFAEAGELPSKPARAPTAVVKPPTANPTSRILSPPTNTSTQQVLSQLVFRNRSEQVALKKAAELLREGHSTEGLALLQQILDQPHDSFQWSDTESTFQSSHRAALQILGSLPPPLLEKYERLYGPEAERDLANAKVSGLTPNYAEVARRFYYTTAGFEASDWLATRWLDTGQYELAAKNWARLLADPVHARRVTNTLCIKAVLAERLAAGTVDFSAQSNSSGVEQVRTTSIGRFTLDDLGLPTPGEVKNTSAEWNVAFRIQKSSRASADSSLPYLGPAWQVDLAEDQHHEVAASWSHWEGEQIRNQRSVAVSNYPILTGRLVVLRDFEGIRAIDAATGETAWKYIGASSLSLAAAEVDELEQSQPDGSVRNNVLNVLFHTHAGNAALGTLTSDGRKVFAIDALDIRPRHASRSRSSTRGGQRRANTETGDAPEPVARESNRLIALEVEPGPSSGKTVTASWVVGGPIGAPNWFYRMDENDDGQITVEEFTGRAEQFRDIDKNADGSIGLREADVYSKAGSDEEQLAGHFFLGPPLPVDGRLFVMTEVDRQLNLVALKAETGEFLWSQGIGFVDHPVDEDPFRYTLSCTPIYSDGVILCTTQMGVLAAVDAADGLLLWAYYYGDDDASGPFGNWSYSVRRSFGHAGFPCEPVVHGGRVVYLPRQSDQIHCLELRTGRQLWTIPRTGAEYVAAVTDEITVVVDQRYCRGLSLVDGQELWSTRLGMPSGRGVQIGERYLVPLQAGRIATLDIRTGQEIGWAMPPIPPIPPKHLGQPNRSQPISSIMNADKPESLDASAEIEAWRPGNLLLSGDVILSVDTRRLVALPQAAPLLERVRREAAEQGRSPSRIILAAELEATLGHLHSAQSLLTESLRLAPTDTERSRAEHLLREVLFRRLQAGDGEDAAVLGQLDPLLRTPMDRSRFLMLKAETLLRRNDFEGVLATTRAFSDLHLTGLLPVAGDPTYFVSPQSWTLDMVGKVRERIDDVQLDRIETLVDAEQAAALQSGAAAPLEDFLTLYARWPQAARVRNALATRFIKHGQFQRAELQLLESRRGGDASAAADATRLLAELWDRAGLLEEAANLWLEAENHRQSENVQLVKYSTNRKKSQLSPEFSTQTEPQPSSSANYTPTGIAAAAIDRAREPSARINRVRISQELWLHCDHELDAVFGQMVPSNIQTPGGSYQLLQRGNGGNGELSIVDRLTGIVVSNIDMTGSPTGMNRIDNTQVGHFIPLGSGTAMNGLSLLETKRDKPVWIIASPGLGPDVESISPGPAGPTFCVFQARRHLIAVDPATGRILWQRTDVDPNSGLEADKYRGIIGDEHVLVVFGSDRASYTVYRTMTGEELRRGKLDVSHSRRPNERHAFGRMFCHFVSTEDGEQVAKRMRLWDPLHDRFVFDIPVSEDTLSCDTFNGEIVLLMPPARLLILDGYTGTVRADLELDRNDVAAARRISMVSDHARYYVNLNSPHRREDLEDATEETFETSYNRFFVNDLLLPRIDIQGTLIAIDRKSGRVQWTDHSPQRSILRLPQVRLPFLIALSNLDDRTDGNRKSLMIEVIDAATGEIIGSKENAMRGRISHFIYDHERGRIELHGQNSVIHLDFGGDIVQRLGVPTPE